MSQHTFNTLDGKVVLAGYDRNCGEYFYSIYPHRLAEEPIHTSITDRSTNVRQLQSVREAVTSLVPGLPESMWSSILDDAMNDMGNRIVHWDTNGCIKFDSEAQ
jgi:hypothetical protein